jgi:hypothetical protein
VIGVDMDGVSRLVNLDPTTLAETAPGHLPFDGGPTSQVLSPDRKMIAFGTSYDGTIIELDPSTFARSAVVQVLRKRAYGETVLLLVSWPSSHLIVTVAQDSAAHELRPGRLLLIDPVSGHVRRQIPLRGSALAETAALGGTAVILVGDLHDTGPGHLVIVDKSGRVRSVTVPAVKAGWNTEGDQQSPGLLVQGQTAYVVGEGESVTSVDLGSLAAETHLVPGLMAERIVPLEPARAPGSGGIFRRISRSVRWAGPHELLVTGGDTFPSDGGSRNQGVTHPAMLVDTRTWRLTRTFHGAGWVEIADHGRVFLAWMTSFAKGREVDRLAALTRSGRTLWQQRLDDTYANLFDGRLTLSHVSGLHSVELNVRTGKPARQVGTWDHAYLIVWSLRSGMTVL